MNKKRILIICPPETDVTIEKDYEILKDKYNVKVLVYRGKKDRFKLLREIINSDINISWFAWTYAKYAVFFSKIFRKKSVVIAAGFDVVNMPEINYGAMTNPKNAKLVRYSIENANKVIAVSDHLKDNVLKYTNRKDVETVYHAFDYNKFTPDGEKLSIAISVGDVTKSNLQRKGLETFVRSAKYLPNIKFILIGNHVDDTINYLRKIASSNVEFTGFVTPENLMEYYQKAKVYVQVSAHEGFGMAIAEAMLCECVPVVTDRGAIPEVVGDAGFYVPHDNPEATSKAIEEAMQSDIGKKARDRVKNLFSIEKREKELIKTLESFVD